jgi:large subunit ribosomal protein L21
MFAIVQFGSTQYTVREKDEILVDKMGLEEGKNVMADKVLLYSDDEGKKVEIGTPYLENVKVETRVLGEERGEKIRVFKMKPKKRYKKTQGYRSDFTRLKILKISALSKKAPAKKAA